MVFSSLPPYLDPSNWHPTNTPQPQPQPQPHGGGPGGSGSIRPGSMSERALQANIPMPESALKCPRCDSTNTKFCYFNNYSLSQPRHFCKTCRRYWTRGGALRTVPVGGGCRRNTKRSSSTSKSSSKSSPATSTDKPAAPYSGGLFQPLSFAGDIIQPTSDALLHHSMMGGAGFHGGACSSNFLGFEQWKNMQQFPFLGGLDPPAPGPQLFSGELGFLGGGDQFRPKMSSSFLSQLASVKMEESKNNNTTHADLSNLVSRELMLGNDDQWINMNGASGGGNWTELSGFSSSTSNHLQ